VILAGCFGGDGNPGSFENYRHMPVKAYGYYSRNGLWVRHPIPIKNMGRVDILVGLSVGQDFAAWLHGQGLTLF
jgi:hypothetical protein